MVSLSYFLLGNSILLLEILWRNYQREIFSGVGIVWGIFPWGWISCGRNSPWGIFPRRIFSLGVFVEKKIHRGGISA